MWFGGRQKVPGFGAVVLAMTFALAGCGTGSKLGGSQAAENVLPPRDSMPTELGTVINKPSSRALNRKKCSFTADMPSGWCEDAVAEGHTGYGNGDGSKRLLFDVIVYRNDTAAKYAFRKWNTSIRHTPSKYRIVNADKFGSESMVFVGASGASRDDQQIVIHEGHFVGTVKFLGSGKRDALDATLSKMSDAFVKRMQKED